MKTRLACEKNANETYSRNKRKERHKPAKKHRRIARHDAVQLGVMLYPVSSRDEKMREANEGNGKR